MSESDKPKDTLDCPICHHKIGDVIEIEALPVLVIDGNPCRHWDGWCGKCGFKMSWSFSDKLMEKIVRNHQREVERG
jgi:hypothetical protein